MADNPFADLIPEGASQQVVNPSPSVSADEINVDALPEGLKPYAPAFVQAGKQYGIDPNFLAAISWNETGGGTSRAFRSGNNAMGISNASGPIYGFNSPEDSIFQQASTLARPNGPYRGASTIREVGSIYAPIGAENDPYHQNADWTGSVGEFYNRLTGKGRNASVLNASGYQKPEQQQMENPFADLIPKSEEPKQNMGQGFVSDQSSNPYADLIPSKSPSGFGSALASTGSPQTFGSIGESISKLYPQETNQTQPEIDNPIENALRNFASSAATTTLNSIGGAIRYLSLIHI